MRCKIALAAALLAVGVPATPADHRAGQIAVHDAWARELPPVSRTGAAYVSLHNTGHRDDRLVTAASPAAARVEMHAHEHAAGMMRMRRIDGVDVPAGERVHFEPGRLHLMLIGLERPLVAGDRFALILEFEHAGRVRVPVDVRKEAPHAGHAGAGPAGHSGTGDASPGTGGHAGHGDAEHTGPGGHAGREDHAGDAEHAEPAGRGGYTHPPK